MNDLTQIKGIGAATAKKLVAAGIDTFAHLAGLKFDDATLVAIEKDAEKRSAWISAAIEIVNSESDPGVGDGDADQGNSTTETSDAGSRLAGSGDPSGGKGSDGTKSKVTARNNRESKNGGSGDPAAPARHFAVISNVLHDGSFVKPGGSVRVTERQFDELKAAGAVEGSWADGEAE